MKGTDLSKVPDCATSAFYSILIGKKIKSGYAIWPRIPVKRIHIFKESFIPIRTDCSLICSLRKHLLFDQISWSLGSLMECSASEELLALIRSFSLNRVYLSSPSSGQSRSRCIC